MSNLGEDEIRFTFPKPKTYELRYHHSKKDSIKRESNCFSCNAPDWIDAVNLWIDHCNTHGYENYYLDYVSEDI